jgi:hypothetical protein
MRRRSVTRSCQSTTTGFSGVSQERTSTLAHLQCHCRSWLCAGVCFSTAGEPLFLSTDTNAMVVKVLHKLTLKMHVEGFRR